MALDKQIWIADIEENLYENNEFLTKCVSHDEYVDNRTVTVPQAGSNPNVEKNRLIVPAPISKREDTDLSYLIDEYTTDPVILKDFEAIQISYNKRQSILRQHYDTITQRAGFELLVKWAATNANAIFRTSGSNSATALAPGATGQRKAVVGADLIKLAQKLDSDLVPSNNRVLIMSVGMYYQLFGDSDFKSSFIMGQPTLPNGKIKNAYGFDIYVKPTIAVYDNAAALKAYGAATATTDHLSCLAYHPSYVAKAMGDTTIYFEADKPAYYGSLFSAALIMGGTKLRSTQVGVAQLVQDPAA